MYERVEKSKEKKSRAAANSVAQNKSKGKLGFGFVDNRPVAIVQRKLNDALMKSNKDKVYQRTILTEATNFEGEDILTMEGGREKAAELEVSNATKKIKKITGMGVGKLTSGNKVNESEKVIIIAHREKSSFTRWPPEYLVQILIDQHGVKDGMNIELLGCHTAGEKVADAIKLEFEKKGYNNMNIVGYQDIMVVGEEGPVPIEHSVATEWWKMKAVVVKKFEEKIGRRIFEELSKYLDSLNEEDIKSYAEFLSDGAKKPIKTSGKYINLKTMKVEILRRAKDGLLKGDIIKNAQSYLWDLQGALTEMNPIFIDSITQFLKVHTQGISEIQQKYEDAITKGMPVLEKTIEPNIEL
ncbi:hypothetical protein [Pseudoalteromonas sp. MMG005]|uniref:hypothetical protein n=1 Tax=Pseudoalteromonas sp. MMG005 TaxID=2822682 RepID=UPI001B3A2B23|nr:hypothetical protein [Pseudoalteromonas sp. MMG005]MBQ4845278.1 hypothetical protein [Pseudoalteromonas sp. MMG005]